MQKTEIARDTAIVVVEVAGEEGPMAVGRIPDIDRLFTDDEMQIPIEAEA